MNHFLGYVNYFKLVETFQPFFGLKFCCFLSWRNDPTKLRGGLQHLMPAINISTEGLGETELLLGCMETF